MKNVSAELVTECVNDLVVSGLILLAVFFVYGRREEFSVLMVSLLLLFVISTWSALYKFMSKANKGVIRWVLVAGLFPLPFVLAIIEYIGLVS